MTKKEEIKKDLNITFAIFVIVVIAFAITFLFASNYHNKLEVCELKLEGVNNALNEYLPTTKEYIHSQIDHIFELCDIEFNKTCGEGDITIFFDVMGEKFTDKFFEDFSRELHNVYWQNVKMRTDNAT